MSYRMKTVIRKASFPGHCLSAASLRKFCQALVLLNPNSRLTNIGNLLGYKGVPDKKGGSTLLLTSQKLQAISTGKSVDRQGGAELAASGSGQHPDRG